MWVGPHTHTQMHILRNTMKLSQVPPFHCKTFLFPPKNSFWEISVFFCFFFGKIWGKPTFQVSIRKIPDVIFWGLDPKYPGPPSAAKRSNPCFRPPRPVQVVDLGNVLASEFNQVAANLSEVFRLMCTYIYIIYYMYIYTYIYIMCISIHI